jgi:hypothetical protein
MSDADNDANGTTHFNANTLPDGNTNADQIPYQHGYADANRHLSTYGYTYTDLYAIGYANAITDFDAFLDTYTDTVREDAD